MLRVRLLAGFSTVDGARLDKRLVHVAPPPVLAGPEGGDYRMARKARPVLSSATDLWESLDPGNAPGV